MTVGEVYNVTNPIMGDCTTSQMDMQFQRGTKLKVKRINKRDKWVECTDDLDQGKVVWSFNLFEFMRSTELTHVNNQDLQLS